MILKVLFIILMAILVISAAVAGMFFGYVYGSKDAMDDLYMFIAYIIKNKEKLDNSDFIKISKKISEKEKKHFNKKGSNDNEKTSD